MKRLLAPFAVWLIVGALCGAAERKQLTFEAITEEEKAPGNPVWSPDAKEVLYEQDDGLWLLSVPSGKRKKLLELKKLEEAAEPLPEDRPFTWKNRRISEKPIQWLPDSRRLLVMRKGDLFLVEKATGKWKALTQTPVEEADPKLAPDGSRISFVRETDLWVLDVASGKETRLTRSGTSTLWNGRPDWVYPEDLDLGTAHWWSPDGQRIAYLQFDLSPVQVFPQVDLLHQPARAEPQRYPKAGTPNSDVRLGVVPAEGGQTRWLDTGDPRGRLLARVEWLPKGDRLAAIRLNRVQDRLDLLLIDPSSGNSKVLIEESDPYWINLSDAFHFLKDRPGLIWSSERDGFRHLYLYDLEGNLVRRLTSGEWGVTELAAVDEQEKTIYYVSSEESPLDRQLYRISLAGGGKRKLTPQPGIHTVTLSPDNQWFVDIWSNLKSPVRREIRRIDGKKSIDFDSGLTAFAAEYDLPPVEIVPFVTKDGAQLRARLIKPENFDPQRKYPAIVMVYGGPHAQRVRNAFDCRCWEQVMAQRGFIIWEVDNRGTAGRGHAWEAKVYRNLGAQELSDQLEGLDHLLSLGFVDPAKVGIYGWSYGGYMTLMALLKAPDRFRAGIAGAPVTDWSLYDTIYTERYMGLPQENPKAYKESSPVTHAEHLKAELLLVHNLQDDNVHFQQTVRMADALVKAGKLFQTVFYSQKTHAATGAAKLHLYKTMAAFFERTLMPAGK